MAHRAQQLLVQPIGIDHLQSQARQGHVCAQLLQQETEGSSRGSSLWGTPLLERYCGQRTEQLAEQGRLC
jgi:hypothetical protein